MDIDKSTRHQKIIGVFGEWLVCNWLSRSGFEVAVVDHTGLDVIAYHPVARQRLGISVKSRTRSLGKESESVILMGARRAANDRAKLVEACQAFGCEPWIAVYVETTSAADVYLTSLAHYETKYRGNPATLTSTWRMDSRRREQYDADPFVKHIRLTFQATQWWGQQIPEDTADNNAPVT